MFHFKQMVFVYLFISLHKMSSNVVMYEETGSIQGIIKTRFPFFCFSNVNKSYHNGEKKSCLRKNAHQLNIY